MSNPKQPTPPVSNERIAALKALAAELKSAPSEVKNLFSDALGTARVTQAPTRARHRTTTEDARSIVLSGGDFIGDPDFLPVPPEHIATAGQGAVDEYHRRWREGFQRGESGGFTDEILHQEFTGEVGAIR